MADDFCTEFQVNGWPKWGPGSRGGRVPSRVSRAYRESRGGVVRHEGRGAGARSAEEEARSKREMEECIRLGRPIPHGRISGQPRLLNFDSQAQLDDYVVNRYETMNGPRAAYGGHMGGYPYGAHPNARYFHRPAPMMRQIMPQNASNGAQRIPLQITNAVDGEHFDRAHVTLALTYPQQVPIQQIEQVQLVQQGNRALVLAQHGSNGNPRHVEAANQQHLQIRKAPGSLDEPPGLLNSPFSSPQSSLSPNEGPPNLLPQNQIIQEMPQNPCIPAQDLVQIMSQHRQHSTPARRREHEADCSQAPVQQHPQNRANGTAEVPQVQVHRPLAILPANGDQVVHADGSQPQVPNQQQALIQMIPITSNEPPRLSHAQAHRPQSSPPPKRRQVRHAGNQLPQAHIQQNVQTNLSNAPPELPQNTVHPPQLSSPRNQSNSRSMGVSHQRVPVQEIFQNASLRSPSSDSPEIILIKTVPNRSHVLSQSSHREQQLSLFSNRHANESHACQNQAIAVPTESPQRRLNAAPELSGNNIHQPQVTHQIVYVRQAPNSSGNIGVSQEVVAVQQFIPMPPGLSQSSVVPPQPTQSHFNDVRQVQLQAPIAQVVRQNQVPPASISESPQLPPPHNQPIHRPQPQLNSAGTFQNPPILSNSLQIPLNEVQLNLFTVEQQAFIQQYLQNSQKSVQQPAPLTNENVIPASLPTPAAPMNAISLPSITHGAMNMPTPAPSIPDVVPSSVTANEPTNGSGGNQISPVHPLVTIPAISIDQNHHNLSPPDVSVQEVNIIGPNSNIPLGTASGLVNPTTNMPTQVTTSQLGQTVSRTLTESGLEFTPENVQKKFPAFFLSSNAAPLAPIATDFFPNRSASNALQSTSTGIQIESDLPTQSISVSATTSTSGAGLLQDYVSPTSSQITSTPIHNSSFTPVAPRSQNLAAITQSFETCPISKDIPQESSSGCSVAPEAPLQNTFVQQSEIRETQCPSLQDTAAVQNTAPQYNTAGTSQQVELSRDYLSDLICSTVPSISKESDRANRKRKLETSSEATLDESSSAFRIFDAGTSSYGQVAPAPNNYHDASFTSQRLTPILANVPEENDCMETSVRSLSAVSNTDTTSPETAQPAAEHEQPGSSTPESLEAFQNGVQHQNTGQLNMISTVAQSGTSSGSSIENEQIVLERVADLIRPQTVAQRAEEPNAVVDEQMDVEEAVGHSEGSVQLPSPDDINENMGNNETIGLTPQNSNNETTGQQHVEAIQEASMNEEVENAGENVEEMKEENTMIDVVNVEENVGEVPNVGEMIDVEIAGNEEEDNANQDGLPAQIQKTYNSSIELPIEKTEEGYKWEYVEEIETDPCREFDLNENNDERYHRNDSVDSEDVDEDDKKDKDYKPPPRSAITADGCRVTRNQERQRKEAENRVESVKGEHVVEDETKEEEAVEERIFENQVFEEEEVHQNVVAMYPAEPLIIEPVPKIHKLWIFVNRKSSIKVKVLETAECNNEFQSLHEVKNAVAILMNVFETNVVDEFVFECYTRWNCILTELHNKVRAKKNSRNVPCLKVKRLVWKCKTREPENGFLRLVRLCNSDYLEELVIDKEEIAENKVRSLFTKFHRKIVWNRLKRIDVTMPDIFGYPWLADPNNVRLNIANMSLENLEEFLDAFRKKTVLQHEVPFFEIKLNSISWSSFLQSKGGSMHRLKSVTDQENEAVSIVFLWKEESIDNDCQLLCKVDCDGTISGKLIRNYSFLVNINIVSYFE